MAQKPGIGFVVRLILLIAAGVVAGTYVLRNRAEQAVIAPPGEPKHSAPVGVNDSDAPPLPAP